jgi:hypothetical protein
MSSISNEMLVWIVRKGYVINDKGELYTPDGKLRKLDIDKRGYYRFSVQYKGCCRGINAHRLVAYIKYGDKMFEPGIEVRHLNGNRVDLSYNNIVIGTHHDNMMDVPKQIRIKNGNIASKKGGESRRKFTIGEVNEIKKLNKHGISYKKLSIAYHTAKSTLSYIINNKTYRQV